MSLYDIKETPLEGCLEILPNRFIDERGKFVKIFHEESFDDLGLIKHFQEVYVSESPKGVLRGLHFQTPPCGHVKVVSCLCGAVLDVVVDLRKASDTFGQHYAVELSAERNNMLYVPVGFAHGFYVTSERTLFASMNSKKYSAADESGIRWDSIGFDWPDKQPILSSKDRSLIKLKHYDSLF